MPRTKTTLKRVFYVRHGESIENKDGKRRGELGELTDLGKRQAEAVGRRMLKFGIERLVCSPAERALDTAQIIADITKLKIETSDLLSERQRPAATLGMHTDHPVVRKIHGRLDVLGELMNERELRDAESLRDMVPAVKEALVSYESHPAERTGAISHNTRIRLTHTYVRTLGNLNWLDFPDQRATYYTLDLDNGGITCVRYGDMHKHAEWLGWQNAFTNDISHLEDL